MQYFDYVTIRGMRLVESVLEFCMRGVAFVDSVVTLVVSKWEQRKEFAWVLDYAKVCVGIVVEFLFLLSIC